jgi:cytochrome c oxidase assembly protein subunit 15
MDDKTVRFLKVWLIIACLLVFTIMVVGGLTRLTHSGLSMVEWKPLMGTIPPLNEERWDATFDLYKQFPEYQKLNVGMTLAEFKSIFLWEYFHRMLGRLIGIVFTIPFLYLLSLKRLNRQWTRRLLIMFMLGLSQGLLGWYMVKSGLIDNPYVSHYRLAAHLIMAFILTGYIFWSYLLLTNNGENDRSKRNLKLFAWIILVVVLLQVVYGAFTAGLKAGFAFNTFPKMNGSWLPPGFMSLSPVYKNIIENPYTVQFLHRMLGWLVTFLIIILWIPGIRKKISDCSTQALKFLTGWVIVQFLLGVFTLIFVIPIWLAVLHQAGAMILFLLSAYFIHTLSMKQL